MRPLWVSTLPRGFFGKWGNTPDPLGLPRGCGLRLGIRAACSLSAGGTHGGGGSSKGFGDRALAFSRLNFLRWEPKRGIPRGHPLPVLIPFLAGEAPRIILCGGEQLIWLVRLHCGASKALSLLSVCRVFPQLRGRQSEEKMDSVGAIGMGS